jgi:undecaprenyl-diphosphatase
LTSAHVGRPSVTIRRTPGAATNTTLILTAALGAGVLAGVVVGCLVGRWPPLGSPHLGAAGIARRVLTHPRLARLARKPDDAERTTAMILVAVASAVVFGATALGVLLFMIRGDIGLARLDVRFATFGARHATETSTQVLRTISLLGGTTGVIAVAAVIGGVEYVRIRSRALPGFLAVVVLGQFAIANLVKWLVDRARPTIDQLTGFAGTSFPSGHATAAAATFAALALVAGRGRSDRMKAALVGAAAAIAAVVAATRVLLGVHWFTDVLGGLVIGWSWFAICSILFGGRWLHFGAPVETAERVADAVAAPPRSTVGTGSSRRPTASGGPSGG